MLLVTACGSNVEEADSSAEAAGGASPEEASPDEASPEEASPEEVSPAQALDFDQLHWIVPFSPGGGTDTTSRQLQPFLEEELGMPIEVENIPGGSQAIGTTAALNEGADCSTVFVQAIPHVSLSWMLQDVGYTYDDIAAVGRISVDAGVVRVANDASWQTMQDLMDDALARPNEISFSTSGFSSANYLALVDIMNRTGAQFNIVNFDGGNPARLAVVRGEVDATHATVYNSLHVAGETRVLAVHEDENNWPDLTDDAPTMSEALGLEDLPPAPSFVALFASSECKNSQPEAYQALHDALERAVTSDGFRQALEETNEQGKIGWLGGEELDEFIISYAEDLREIIKGIPELELVQ